MLGSGMSPHRLEWQLIARARPGIVDTSALPMDLVSNPGTMNAIINFARRPAARAPDPEVAQGRAACPAGADETTCWCEPGKPGKCWERSEQTEIGAEHPQGRRGLRSAQRGDPARLLQHRLLRRAVLDQPRARPARGRSRRSATTARRRSTSASAGATARASARSRTGSTTSWHFFLTARPDRSLASARGYADPRDLEIAARSGVRSKARSQRGRDVFARTCAALPFQPERPPYENVDFHAADPSDPTLRLDWLGNDEPVLASRDRHLPGRALHSNHMASRVWDAIRRARPARAPGRSRPSRRS